MALFAVLMCLNFASCSSSDDGEPSNKENTSGKLLIKMKCEDGYSEPKLFFYNNNRQLIKVTEGNSNATFTWDDNQITVSYHHGQYRNETATLYLKNGIITSIQETNSFNSYITSLTYDNNNHLIGYRNNLDSEETWTWSNGNVISNSYSIVNATYYTDKANKHTLININDLNFDYIVNSTCCMWLLEAHPYLIGTPYKNLLKSTTSNSSGHAYDYTYELDSDGYPIKIIQTENNSYGFTPLSYTYTLTWE